MMSVYVEIQEERERQDKKWGEQKHFPVVWMTILGEEFGEACKEALEEARDGEFAGYRKELIQVAAAAIAAIECLDRKRYVHRQRSLTESVLESIDDVMESLVKTYEYKSLSPDMADCFVSILYSLQQAGYAKYMKTSSAIDDSARVDKSQSAIKDEGDEKNVSTDID